MVWRFAVRRADTHHFLLSVRVIWMQILLKFQF